VAHTTAQYRHARFLQFVLAHRADRLVRQVEIGEGIACADESIAPDATELQASVLRHHRVCHHHAHKE